MDVPFNNKFDEQRKIFGFRFTCEHCTYFDDSEQSCSHGFPNGVHRLSHYDGPAKPETIIFCKEFDLC